MKEHFLIFIVLFAVIATGCIAPADETEPQPGFVEDGDLEYIHDRDYVINGSLELRYVEEESAVFHDVMLCVFDDTGDVLASANLGTLEAPIDSEQVSMSFNDEPKYVIVDHLRFREGHDVDPLVREWHDEGTRPLGLPEDDIVEFEYRPPQESGACGSVG